MNSEFNKNFNKLQRGHFLYLNDHFAKDYTRMVSDYLDSNQNDKPRVVRQRFFSNENIERIQRKLRLNVFRKSNKRYSVAKQNKANLTIVMEAMYFKFSRNLPYDIPQQIEELNDIVVNEVTPGIITAMEQYEGYIKDITTPIRPIDRPRNMSTRGTKTLSSTLNTRIY